MAHVNLVSMTLKGVILLYLETSSRMITCQSNKSHLKNNYYIQIILSHFEALLFINVSTVFPATIGCYYGMDYRLQMI